MAAASGIEITPEPAPEIAAAIELALGATPRGRPAEGAWWRAGLDESLRDETDLDR